MVEETLCAELAEALPELLQLTELEVSIRSMPPWRWSARGLNRETVSAVGTRVARPRVVHSEWLSQEVLGLAEALAWPATALVNSPRL